MSHQLFIAAQLAVIAVAFTAVWRLHLKWDREYDDWKSRRNQP